MSSNIRLKRSAVADKIPTTSNLQLGELAINTYDGKIFLKKDVSGTESIVTLEQITEDNLGIDSSTINNSASSTLADVLSDFDSAITARATKSYVQSLINSIGDSDVYSVFLDAAEQRVLAVAKPEKSIRFYVQAWDQTTNDIYASEINILYDGTNVHMVEHSIIDTYHESNGSSLVSMSAMGPNTSITDSSGDAYTTENEIGLTVTRNANVSNTLIVKYLRMLVDDFPEIGVTDGTSETTISSVSADGNNFVTYEVIGLNVDNAELERTNVIVLNDGTDIHYSERNLIHSSGTGLSSYDVTKSSGYINLKATPASADYRVYRVARLYKDTIWEETSTTDTTQTEISSENKGTYRTMFYTIRVSQTDDQEYQQTQLVVTHDGSDVYTTEHSIVYTGTAELAAFTADFSGDDIRLLATPASNNNMTFQVTRKIIEA